MSRVSSAVAHTGCEGNSTMIVRCMQSLPDRTALRFVGCCGYVPVHICSAVKAQAFFLACPSQSLLAFPIQSRNVAQLLAVLGSPTHSQQDATHFRKIIGRKHILLIVLQPRFPRRRVPRSHTPEPQRPAPRPPLPRLPQPSHLL